VGIFCVVWLVAYVFYFKEEEPAPAVPRDLLSLAETETGAPETLAAEPETPRPVTPPPVPGTVPPVAARPGTPRTGPSQTGVSRTTAPKALRGKIALILDDAGYQNALLKVFLSFPGPLTVAILPGLPGSAEAARLVRNAGKQLMLHLPMEPKNGQDPGPDAIFGHFEDAAITGLTNRHIDSLPGIVGVNNHMGSRATEDERVMRLVLDAVKRKGLFFIDSRTSARSAARRIAEELKLPFGERAVFLDNEKDKTAIRKAFQAGKAIAEKQGRAIMIGHVWCAELAEVLLELYPVILDEGYQFYPVAELLKGEPPG
jgi:polysaccharide deacetylase 2 family uncharacterized protein YibQ